MELVVNFKVSDSEHNKIQYLYFRSHHPRKGFSGSEMYALIGGIKRRDNASPNTISFKHRQLSVSKPGSKDPKNYQKFQRERPHRSSRPSNTRYCGKENHNSRTKRPVIYPLELNLCWLTDFLCSGLRDET